MSISCIVALEKQRDKNCEPLVDTTCSVQLRLHWLGKHGVCARRAFDRLSGTSWESGSRGSDLSKASCMRRAAKDDQHLNLKHAVAQPNTICLEI